jgi:hypothetical protein
VSLWLETKNVLCGIEDVVEEALWLSWSLILVVGWLFVNVSKLKLVIWNHTFEDTGMDKVDTWSNCKETLAVVKDRVEVSEEWLSKNKFISLVELEWNEALASNSNVNYKTLWHQFNIISIIHKEVDRLIFGDITWSKQKIILKMNAISLVENLRVHWG